MKRKLFGGCQLIFRTDRRSRSPDLSLEVRTSVDDRYPGPHPRTRERIVAQATAQGLSVKAYLLTVIEAAAAPAPTERASLEEFEAAMDELADGLDDVAVLAPEALTREAICGHRG